MRYRICNTSADIAENSQNVVAAWQIIFEIGTEREVQYLCRKSKTKKTLNSFTRLPGDKNSLFF